jgi:hypothetical protein
MSYKKREKKMESHDLQSGNIQPEQNEVVIRDDEKFEVEIREIVRIKPQDFKALKDSFEEWRNKWEK